MSTVAAQFLQIRQAYAEIYVIIAPPRSGSTALSRVFWEQPSIRYYAHEPFEIVYYQQRGVDEMLAKLRNPRDLTAVKRNPGDALGRSLVIKEMPYQVGDSFRYLASLTRKPVVFLIRDPRQNISSRMRKKIEVGDPPLFPLIESGWTLLDAQIEHCRNSGIPFTIIDSGDFRRSPIEMFKLFFDAIGLPFSPEYLKWRSLPNYDLDNLEGDHSHLYTGVLGSEGLTPDTDPLPEMDDFPESAGFRDHVIECQQIYRRLRELPELIKITAD
jgi:hypothetical protein